MSIRRRIVESMPGLRWRYWRVITAVMFRPVFAEFGPRSVIVSPRMLRGVEQIHIGSDCAIYADVWLQCEDGGSITLGDGVNLTHGVHIHSVDPVRIGNNSLFGVWTTITSAEHTGGDRSGFTGSGPITIGDNVFVGDRVTIVGGVTIGDGATVAAAAVVTHDVPAGVAVGGIPARPLGKDAS
jgi:acetyltransferase-like isoleucine patch superfamily enzyme